MKLQPEMIAIEPTNFCNLNCPYCLVGMYDQLPEASHQHLRRPRGYMDVSLYKKIISDAVNFGVRWVHLQFQGESLLHPAFDEMVKIAKQAGINTHVYTNGLLITADLANRLVESGLDSMSFSIDGASEDTYSKTKGCGNFDKVIQNLKIMKEVANKSNLYLTWQLLITRYNETEVEKARKMAEEIGVHFYIKKLCVTDVGLVPNNKEYVRRLRIKPCQDIYKRLLICWNGDVVPCIFDTEANNVIGNVANNSLRDIWANDAFLAIRRRIDRSVSLPDDEPEFCKKCLRWGFDQFSTSNGFHSWS